MTVNAISAITTTASIGCCQLKAVLALQHAEVKVTYGRLTCRQCQSTDNGGLLLRGEQRFVREPRLQLAATYRPAAAEYWNDK
jgi:hypothetical protein